MNTFSVLSMQLTYVLPGNTAKITNKTFLLCILVLRRQICTNFSGFQIMILTVTSLSEGIKSRISIVICLHGQRNWAKHGCLIGQIYHHRLMQFANLVMKEMCDNLLWNVCFRNCKWQESGNINMGQRAWGCYFTEISAFFLSLRRKFPCCSWSIGSHILLSRTINYNYIRGQGNPNWQLSHCTRLCWSSQEQD